MSFSPETRLLPQFVCTVASRVESPCLTDDDDDDDTIGFGLWYDSQELARADDEGPIPPTTGSAGLGTEPFV